MMMWRFIKSINVFSANLISVVVSLVFIFTSIYLILKNTTNFPLAIPLWFSNPWGVERLADPIFLWLLPAAGFVVLLSNFLLSRYFRERNRELFFLLVWTSPVVSGFFFYTLLQIIFVST
jgi:hypothetical protein